MPLKLEDIFKKLETVESGAEMTSALQTEFARLRNEAAGHRIKSKKVFETLGIPDSDEAETVLEGLKASIAALKTTGKPDEIGKQIAELNAQVKKLSGELAAQTEKATAERDKRINATKINEALAALQEGNAANPAELAKIVLQNVKVKDDDSLAYLAGEKETTIKDGVKAWLDANPWAVKNPQNSGAGSAGGSGTPPASMENLPDGDYVEKRLGLKK